MRIFKNVLVLSLFVLLCAPAYAQVLNRINRSVQNAAERAAERAVTKKAEQEVAKAIEKGIEAGEKGVNAAEKGAQAANEKNAEKKTSEPEPYTGPIIPAPKDNTKFPFEHGSYVEEMNALGIEAKHTVYFTRSGEWIALEDKSDIKMFGISISVDKLHIQKGNQHWDLDLVEKTGTYYEGNGPQEDTNAMISAALGGKPEEGMEVIDLGEEVYMGYTCKKIEVKYPVLAMDLVCLSYGSLVMKSDGTVGPLKTTTRITSIDLSAPPASKFEVPAGITID